MRVLHLASPAFLVIPATQRLWGCGPEEEGWLPESWLLTLIGSDASDELSPNLSGFARQGEPLLRVDTSACAGSI